MVEQLLQLEAAFEALGLEAQLADELGQRLQLSRRRGRRGRGGGTCQPVGREQLGHRLVGRQHELLDDLMALGVLGHVGAGHAAVVVEIDLHLGHGQFERAALEPALAEDHRQLVHPPQQGVDLGR